MTKQRKQYSTEFKLEMAKLIDAQITTKILADDEYPWFE